MMPAPYMRWAKTRPVPGFDLAGSNLLACTMADLPGARDTIELNGPNPDGYAPLLDAIAARYGVPASHVATAPGASGANFLVIAALVSAGDEVLVERPAYDPLLGAARLMGARIARFDRTFQDGFDLDVARIEAALSPATRLVVLTSPHNPSGALISDAALAALAALADREGFRVLVDEVYLDGVYGGRPVPAALRSDLFISTSSLTKAYGLSGLRAGWIVAEPVVTRAVHRTRDVVDGIGSFPSDRLSLLAFGMLDRLEARARAILEPNLASLAAFIDAREEVEWVRPAGGNVAFPRLQGEADTSAFADRLLEQHGTAIVPGRFFEAPAHFRIAFGCTAAVLGAGLERLGRGLDDRNRDPST
jgi:hypothetical protein